MLTMIELYIYKRNADNDTFIREMLTMIELYIYKRNETMRNAHNDWTVHLQWLNCTFIREMLTMIDLYIYKRNAHNDWTDIDVHDSVHL